MFLLHPRHSTHTKWKKISSPSHKLIASFLLSCKKKQKNFQSNIDRKFVSVINTINNITNWRRCDFFFNKMIGNKDLLRTEKYWMAGFLLKLIKGGSGSSMLEKRKKICLLKHLEFLFILFCLSWYHVKQMLLRRWQHYL